MATKIGTNNSDVLTGTTSADAINGLNGNDLINALDGNDSLSGGAGNDFLNGGGGADVILGNDDDDIIDGGAGNDVIDGGAGNDIIIASEGFDDVSGGTGNDTFVVHGAAGDKVTINDSGGIDTLDFSLGSTSATIDMRSGASSFVDGREIVINGGSVTLPLDFVLLQDLSGSFADDIAALRSLVPDLVAQLQSLQPDVRFGVASFVDKPTSPFGSSGDYVYQTDLALTSSGSDFQAAVDNLVVRFGGDYAEAQIEALMQLALRPSELGFRSGTLRTVVVATDAPPHVAGDFAGVTPNNGDNVLDGGGIGEDFPSVDQVRSALLSAGIVPIFAVTEDVLSVYQDLVVQLGFGTVVQLGSDSADIVSAISAGLEAITTVDIENAVGTAQADIITGNDLDNRIDGGAGNDVIDGGAGNDIIIASEGFDDVSGGTGNDTFVVHGAAGDKVTINDSGGIDTLDFSLGSTSATIDMRSGASSFVDGREIVINGGSVTLPLDFVLLQDLSGSFADDIAALRSLVPDLVAQLQSLQPDVRFGVASFVDKPTSPFGSSGDYVYQTDLALTSSGSDFQAAVDNLVVRFGGDYAEAQIEALMQLALRPSELGFRSGTLRTVVVATDAPPHVAGDFAGVTPNNGDNVLDGGGIGEDFPSVDQVRSALLSAGIVPIFAVTEDVLSVYQDLVVQLGFGTVVQLGSDSADIVSAISAGLEAITTVDIENAVGTAQADIITGNDLDNRIDGGEGADSLSGGKGNDTFIVSVVGDTVFETAGQGSDTVQTSVSYVLTAGQSIETLRTTNDTGTGAINLTGNELANKLVGNDGNNILDGGVGSDTLYGRRGDDTFIVSAAGDKVFETTRQGSDTVQASVSYVLAAGQSIETLRTTNDTGKGAINLTGNELANKLVGNDGANVLDGGAGIDALYGRAGNDTYVISVAGDEVFESTGQGTDTVRTSVSYVLAATQSIETLRTTSDTGKGAINLTGNEFANKIVGNDGANLITGNGGADALFGRAGADKFVFKAIADSTVVSTGRDTIDDFSRAEGDRIDLASIDAVAGGGVNQAFKFIGNADFHDRAGELRAVVSGGNTIVSGDVNGDGTADFSILLKGTLTLQAGDFVL